MDIWGPRRVTSLREARRRTALVHIIRLLFTVGAVLAAGLLIGPAIQNAISASAPKYSAPAVTATMIGARFEDLDASGKPYVVTAETARRRREPGVFDLANPRLQNQANTSVQAREGVWNEAEEILDLKGDVVMADAAGYVFTADSARIYVHENRIEGRTPLHGVGPIGEVRADGYEVIEDGDKIVLTGNVWSKFNAKKNRERSARER